MKVQITEILLEVPNGALGIPVRGSRQEILDAIRGQAPGYLELQRADGAPVSISLKRLRDAIAFTELEAQITDARLALPGQQGFLPPQPPR